MKTYYVTFGSGDVRNNFGLAPTFVIFSQNGTAVTPPTISAVTGATGFYSFQYGPTTPIAFLIDGFTTGLNTTDRYVKGAIDPADRSDEYGNTLIAYGLTSIALGTTNVALGTTGAALGVSGIALGTTNVAIGTTLIAMGNTITALGITAVFLGQSGGLGALVGSAASSYGSSTQDPVDLFGYMKRVQENLEGNNIYTKVSGALQIFSRGSSQLLITKTIANSASVVIKS